jgi:membrane peptidoglycan carboxypeptidase
MDLAWQRMAEEEVAGQLARLDPRRRRQPLQGALVVLEPTTCNVRAMVGGRAPEVGDYNRAYQARRQTGSAIKPIVYAAAFASPRGSFTPASCVADTPFTIGRGRSAWTPRNFDGSYHAQVTLAKALEKSLNVATTNLVMQIGPDLVAQVAAEFGLGQLQPVPSIGLGSNEVSLIDLTAAYAAFLDRGLLRTPSPLRVIADAQGAVLHRPESGAIQATSEGVAALMTALLQNVVRYGVAAPLRTVYGFERPVAGKTGTTDEYRDGWFVGFTPDMVAGAWVGFDRPRSIGRQAAHSALPLWARSVGRMLEGFPPAPFALEAQIEWVDIEPWTGERSDSLCARENIPFLRGTAPTWFCGESDPWGYADTLSAGDSAWIETDFEDSLDAPWPDSSAFEAPDEEPDTSSVEKGPP